MTEPFRDDLARAISRRPLAALGALAAGLVWLWLLVRVLAHLGAVFAVAAGADAEAMRNLTQSIALGIAALAGLVTPFVIAIRIYLQWRQSDTAEQGLITDRFTKAVEQLGAEKTVKREDQEYTEPNLEVRLGAIYALERIAQDSLRDHIPVMETLCAYVRENAAEPRIDEAATAEARAEDPEAGPVHRPPRVDVQAALTVMGRRSPERLEHEKAPGRDLPPFSLDLRNCHLARADLTAARLGPALLDRTDLQGASLLKANLQEAQLDGANLQRAILSGAKLQMARLDRTNLIKAGLEDVDLQKAVLVEANLQEARLFGANLQEATLSWADLRRALLFRVNLRNANLESASLQGSRLVSGNMQRARLDGAKLQSADLRGWSIARASLANVDLADCTDLDPATIKSAFGVLSGDRATVLPEGLGLDPATDLAHWNDPARHGGYVDDYRAWLAAGAPTGHDWRDGA